MQLNFALALFLVLIIAVTILAVLFTKELIIVTGIAAAGYTVYTFVIPNIGPLITYISRTTLHLEIYRPNKPAQKISGTELAKVFGTSSDSLPKIMVDGYELMDNVPVSHVLRPGASLGVTFDN
ncbi:hypothetical protein DL89DRAFT_264214 [Linderina pennispora]|uniref:Uncharacterized protein n=1 Tax=Linderina pennispora TaxID=61395 RepID=A0A1Y1WL68_9FUNG|nr:uncharacterized protein DL89DRAFT_264214 [Linderina pennispora]ORX74297.1 hypothetical protein DL89DRAFT_264214 [Linderina pennispora]